MKNEITKGKKFARKLFASAASLAAMGAMTATTAFADGGGDWDAVTINTSNASNASSLMGNVIGILLTITRYVGVALVVYGAYEIVQSFMQNQPEAKTKGIMMALAGVAMIGLKSVLNFIIT